MPMRVPLKEVTHIPFLFGNRSGNQSGFKTLRIQFCCQQMNMNGRPSDIESGNDTKDFNFPPCIII